MGHQHAVGWIFTLCRFNLASLVSIVHCRRFPNLFHHVLDQAEHLMIETFPVSMKLHGSLIFLGQVKQLITPPYSLPTFSPGEWNKLADLLCLFTILFCVCESSKSNQMYCFIYSFICLFIDYILTKIRQKLYVLKTKKNDKGSVYRSFLN